MSFKHPSKKSKYVAYPTSPTTKLSTITTESDGMESYENESFPNYSDSIPPTDGMERPTKDPSWCEYAYQYFSKGFTPLLHQNHLANHTQQYLIDNLGEFHPSSTGAKNNFNSYNHFQHHGLTHSDPTPHRLPQSDKPPDVGSTMLEKLGIDTSSTRSMKDEDKLQRLLSEIVDFKRSADEKIEFKYKGNNQRGQLFIVPKCNGEENFKDREKKTGWLDKILEYSVSDSKAEVDDASSWMLKTLADKNEESFLKLSNKRDPRRVLSEIGTAAMISDAALTTNQARIITKHTKYAFDRSILFPLQKTGDQIVKQWQRAVSRPVFWNYEYRDPKKQNKKPEIVNICLSQAQEEIAYDTKLLLDANAEVNGPNSWGYRLDDGSFGVNLDLGSDHGKGSNQLLAKLKYLSAANGRKTGRLEDGARVTQFGYIKCRKDKKEILAQVAPHMNETFKAFREGMLAGIIDEFDNREVVFLPKKSYESVKFSKEDEKVKMNWTEPEGVNKEKELNFVVSDKLKMWSVIKCFHCNVSGDCAFVATIQGRDGTSSCRCPYCTLTINQWKKGGDKGTKLTLEILRDCQRKNLKYTKDLEEARAKGLKLPKKPETFGVSGPIQWEAEPWDFTLPVLHLLIGLLNKTLQTMMEWLDTHVELIGQEEMQLRRDCNAMICEHQAIVERMEEVKLAMEVAKGNVDLKEEYDELKEENDELVIHRKELRLMVLDAKKAVEKARKARVGDEEGLDTKVDLILNVEKIVPAAFHSGQLNGVDCRRLMDNVVNIVRAIKEEAKKTLVKNRDRFGSALTDEKLDEKMESFNRLLRVMDVVFATLRTPAPTSGEHVTAKESIGVFKELWCGLGISITVKAHILFDHAVDQFVMKEGGVADRGEDFIEKHHQKVGRIDHLFSRMNGRCFEQSQMAALTRMHLQDHPVIKQQIEKVNESSKRDFTVKNRETSDQRKKQARHQNRNDTTEFQWYLDIKNKLHDS
jgi:hypothetical protein